MSEYRSSLLGTDLLNFLCTTQLSHLVYEQRYELKNKRSAPKLKNRVKNTLVPLRLYGTRGFCSLQYIH